MKKTVISAVVLTLIAATTACQKSIEQQAADEARTYTAKNCPVDYGDGLVLDSMTFDEATHTFGYFYTLSGQLDNDSLVGELSETMRQTVLENLRNTTSMRAYKERGYGFHYVYRSAATPDKVLYDLMYFKEDYQ